MSGSAKVPSALGAELGSTRDLDLGGGADADALRGAGVLSAASSLSFWRFSDALPRSASSSGVGGGCCGGGGIDGAAAFAGRSPLGVEGLALNLREAQFLEAHFGSFKTKLAALFWSFHLFQCF